MSNEILFHIGMHKTGTTWLQQYYFTNENIFNLINNTVEPWNDIFLKSVIGVDNASFCKEKSRSILDQGLKDNIVNVISAERLSGHPISGGYDMNKIAERLFKIHPKGKVLLTTRAPKPFVKSVYKQIIREGYCGKPSAFLTSQKWKTAIISKDYFLQNEIKETYTSIFGSKNVLILDFKEFNEAKKSYINKIEKFLGVQNTEPLSLCNTVINKTYSNRRLRSLRALNKFRKSELHPFPIFSFKLKYVLILSKFLGYFYSNKELINSELLSRYLSRE